MLIDLIDHHVQTKSTYLKEIKGEEAFANSDLDHLSSSTLGENPLGDFVLRESEEKALLIFQCFGRKTSVLYDVQSLYEIIKKETSSEIQVEVAA